MGIWVYKGKGVFFTSLLILLLPFVVQALGPHEVLVLANKDSLNSINIARKFISVHGVPDENMVFLDMGELIPGTFEITESEFTDMIWKPAVKVMRERALDDHILAWVYSSGFPVRIKTLPPLSIQGVTFLRNNKAAISECTTKLKQLSDLYDLKAPNVEIDQYLYLSPLFSDPVNPKAEGYSSQTLDSFKLWLGETMPLPSMMLGYVGPGGNSTEEVIACLERSVNPSDKGEVYFIVSDDIRSNCREWQFPAVKKELAELDVRANITGIFPGNADNIIGLMTGSASVDPGKDNVYLPGCMAEHLTSAAAQFGTQGQTKLSAWISAGASASAGAVTEPYSLWPKFPHARFYVHYASGCTMIESFYQSTRSPMQILFVGDPLVAPRSPDASVEILGLDNENVSGVIRVSAQIHTESGLHFGKFLFLLDGRIIGQTNSSGLGKSKVLEIDTSSVKDGAHAVRIAACSSGFLRHQYFAEKKIVVDNKR